MSELRKPPQEQNSRDDSPLPLSDSGSFSIESTAMRLNSLRLRRVEKPNQEVEKAIAPNSDSVAVATGEVAALSATKDMQKLDMVDLKIEEAQNALKTLSAGSRDKGGGFDPYNQLADKPVTRPERERLALDQLTPKKK
jgi:hypothetical protein